MKVVIIRFEDPYAICMKDDRSIIDIKRINIPKEAKEGDELNIEEDTIAIERQEAKEKYVHVDDIILDI